MRPRVIHSCSVTVRWTRKSCSLHCACIGFCLAPPGMSLPCSGGVRWMEEWAAGLQLALIERDVLASPHPQSPHDASPSWATLVLVARLPCMLCRMRALCTALLRAASDDRRRPADCDDVGQDFSCILLNFDLYLVHIAQPLYLSAHQASLQIKHHYKKQKYLHSLHKTIDQLSRWHTHPHPAARPLPRPPLPPKTLLQAAGSRK